MRRFLPKTFSFSKRVTIVTALLATIMIVCSVWQWRRYNWKVGIVETYNLDSKTAALTFPANAKSEGEFSPVIDRRVRVRGHFDYDHEVIVTNKRKPSGPGHFLLAPFQIADTGEWVIVSRGFIPFEDRTPDTWRKYDSTEPDEFTAIVKRSVHPMLFSPKNPKPEPGRIVSLWYFEEIDKIAAQLPQKNVITAVYLQRVGTPLRGSFPEQAISIEVPPSTHYGYMIEWAILACATLAIGFVLQAFPWYRGKSMNSLQPLSNTIH